MSHSIDLKGALALSATIISFLLALTLIEAGISSANLPQIEAAFIVSAISLIVFVIIEKKVASPLVDLRLLKNKILLPAYIILVATGVTMFMQYPVMVSWLEALRRWVLVAMQWMPKCSTPFHDHVLGFC